jgi:hypothetical protein
MASMLSQHLGRMQPTAILKLLKLVILMKGMKLIFMETMEPSLLQMEQLLIYLKSL